MIVAAFAVVVIIFGGIVFLSMPIGKGIHTPRYLFWYKNPLRLISFDFDNYLGISAREGKDVSLGGFQAQMKVNRGKPLKPQVAFLRSINSGKKASIKFRTSQGYEPAANVNLIPQGHYYSIAADFEDLKQPGNGVPVEDFLRNFSGFEFVLEWDGGKFARTFSRAEIDGVVLSFRQYSNPAPSPQIVTKGSS